MYSLVLLGMVKPMNNTINNISGDSKAMRKYLEGIYNLTPKAAEPYFSKTPCPCCGSTLAGERYEFTGTIGKKHTNERAEFICCIDCFEYLFT